MKTNNKNILKAVGILILGLLLGWLIFGGEKVQEEPIHNHEATNAAEVWTCSMHPQIRSNEPGDCPICGMDLIPVEVEESGTDPAVYQMSESAMKLANVQTMVVGSAEATKAIRLNGKIQVDERKTYTQASHIPGRIEQLMINFTGEKISRGQTIAKIYSPELVTAQEELLQAASIRESQPELFEAAKSKFKNWKIGENQINDIVESNQVKQVFPLKADVNGVVTNKMVELGDYVAAGMPIYEISDLSELWVLFDVYESDLAWIKEGSEVSYTVESLPGKSFEGKISFIDPLINPQTRVATARIEVNNKQHLLKPQMFVSGLVENPIDQGKDEIIIPQSAVLWTGKRSVVYVRENGGFKMQEITLGAVLGENYVVQDGLQKGEEIVTNGAFTIDAAAELAGKPSMMNPEEGPAMAGHNHGGMEMPASSDQVKEKETKPVAISQKAKEALQPLYAGYLDLKNALVADDLKESKRAAIQLMSTFGKINMSLFTGEAHNAWMGYSSAMSETLRQAQHQNSIEELRTTFQQISEGMIAMAKAFNPLDQALYIQFCPMADNNKGANWLSTEEEIRNPYFGESMLTCGEVENILK